MPKIEILVSCHKESFVPRHNMIHSIQTGAGLAESRISADYNDSQGENISAKNGSYCELTAQYWAWKNIDADYYGFFHYRRYLSFAQEYPVQEDGKLRCRRWRPYIELDDLKAQWKTCALSEKKIAETAVKYDIITVLREPTNSTVYEQYCQFHNRGDLKKILKILQRMHPDYVQSARRYLRSREHYFTNIYLMSRQEFFSYMEWLFPMLEEFEAQADPALYAGQKSRVAGFLAERLFGIYYTHAAAVRKKRCCELQYAVFADTSPFGKKTTRNRKRIRVFRLRPTRVEISLDMKKVNSLVPPGSKRRIVVRRLFQRFL